MAHVTHDGKPIAEPTGQTAPNPWDAWLQRQRQQGVSGLPACIQQVHREHGVDLERRCKGCVHLRDNPTIQYKGSKQQFKTHHYHCTAYGGDAEWQPDWPACGERNVPQPEPKKQAA